jgi:hypothetical protein
MAPTCPVLPHFVQVSVREFIAVVPAVCAGDRTELPLRPYATARGSSVFSVMVASP